MIYLIHGATHAGKTMLAQKILEAYKVPYLSIDHLKMGLIRSGMTALTPNDDDKMTDFIWPIVREIIKTAIENNQNLTLEGCYIPFNWRESFSPGYLKHIKSLCLILSESYINTHFAAIKSHADDIEKRMDDSGLSQDALVAENAYCLKMCREHACPYCLITDKYEINFQRFF